MHILLVEDDTRVSDYLIQALAKAGYTVDHCRNRVELDAHLASHLIEPPQIILLDRMLGPDDGALMIKQLKSRFPDTKVVILSALDLPTEKARVLDLGADEYLAKPFSLEELTARLRLVSRRSSEARDPEIKVLGNLVVNLKTQNAAVGPEKLDLTRKELQLLTLLLDQPGRVYNRLQILDRVWEVERLVESNVVETTIKNLRRKLADKNCNAKIESRRNIGYWIET